MIEIVEEPHTGMALEHCCFCAVRTKTWFAEKDVAVCRSCAEHKVSADVPSKADWCRSPQAKGFRS